MSNGSIVQLMLKKFEANLRPKSSQEKPPKRAKPGTLPECSSKTSNLVHKNNLNELLKKRIDVYSSNFHSPENNEHNNQLEHCNSVDSAPEIVHPLPLKNDVNSLKTLFELKFEKVIENKKLSLSCCPPKDCCVIEKERESISNKLSNSVEHMNKTTEVNTVVELPKGENQQNRSDFYCQKILEELVSTEKSYLGNLNDLIDNLLENIEYNSENEVRKFYGKSEIGVPCALLTQIRDMHVIFHKKISIALSMKNLKSQVEEFAKYFIQFAELFKLHATYAARHEEASDYIKEARNSVPLIQSIFDNFEQNHESVSSILIQPVQRIPRYKLFLKEVLKKLPHEISSSHLKRAQFEIENAVAFINESIGRRKDRNKLLALHDSFGSLWGSHAPLKLISPQRKLIREGTLTKWSYQANGHKKKLFHLFDDILLYKEQTSKPKIFLLSNQKISFSKVPKTSQIENGICILSKYKCMIVYASSKILCDAWLTDLVGTLQKNQQTLEQRDSMRTSVGTANIESNSDPDEDGGDDAAIDVGGGAIRRLFKDFDRTRSSVGNVYSNENDGIPSWISSCIEYSIGHCIPEFLGRRFVRDGLLWVIQKQFPKYCHVILFNDMLVFCHVLGLSKKAKFLGKVRLDEIGNVEAHDDEENHFMFKVFNRENRPLLEVCTENSSIGREWVSSIRIAMPPPPPPPVELRKSSSNGSQSEMELTGKLKKYVHENIDDDSLSDHSHDLKSSNTCNPIPLNENIMKERSQSFQSPQNPSVEKISHYTVSQNRRSESSREEYSKKFQTIDYNQGHTAIPPPIPKRKKKSKSNLKMP